MGFCWFLSIVMVSEHGLLVLGNVLLSVSQAWGKTKPSLCLLYVLLGVLLIHDNGGYVGARRRQKSPPKRGKPRGNQGTQINNITNNANF